MTAPAGGFWLAKGPCRQCGATAARRVPGAGSHLVTCNVCRAQTPHEARFLAPGGGAAPASPAAPAPAPAPVPPPADAPAPRAPIPVKFLAGLAAASILIAAGITWWAVANLDDAEAREWHQLNQALVPEFGNDTVTFRVSSAGVDAEGQPIPEDELSGLKEWHFGHSPALLASPDQIEWSSCEPRACAYEAPTGSYVYFNRMGPEAFGATAFHTGNRTVLTWSIDEWRPGGDWEDHFRGFVSVKATTQRTGDGEWRMMIFTNASNEDEVRLNVSIVQDGRVLKSEALRVSSIFDSGWKTPEFSAIVEEGPVEVRVTGMDGALLASRTVVPSDCDEIETQVYVAVSASGEVNLDEVLCI